MTSIPNHSGDALLRGLHQADGQAIRGLHLPRADLPRGGVAEAAAVLRLGRVRGVRQGGRDVVAADGHRDLHQREHREGGVHQGRRLHLQDQVRVVQVVAPTVLVAIITEAEFEQRVGWAVF